MKKIKLFAMAIAALLCGTAMAEDVIFSFTVTSSTVATGTYTANGGSAVLSGSVMPTGDSNEVIVGGQTFYKFNSSTKWTFTLSKGTFAVGDTIAFLGASNASSTKKGKGLKLNGSIIVKADFPAGEAAGFGYRIKADDGIAGTNTFTIERTDSDIKFGSVTIYAYEPDAPIVKSYTIAGVEATIDQENETIAAELPFGTEITADTYDTATVVLGGTAVSYDYGEEYATLIVSDGVDANVTYTLNISVKQSASTDATLKDLQFLGETVKGFDPAVFIYYDTIAYAAEEIKAEDMTFQLNDAAATAGDVQKGENQGDVTLSVVVTAQSGAQNTYTLQINRRAASTEKAITSFSLNGIAGAINEDEHTISVNYYSFLGEVTTLTPAIQISNLATISPEGAQDFSNPVTYTVTAEDGSTQDYVVTVIASDIETLAAANMPYISKMDAEWSIPAWMVVLAPESDPAYNPSYSTTSGKSDAACAVDGGAIRIAKEGAIYIKAEKCDSVVAYFSGTGDRKFRVSVVGSDKSFTTGTIKKNNRTRVLLDVESESEVIIKLDMDGANGGGTITGIELYWTAKQPTALRDAMMNGKAQKFMMNNRLYIRHNGMIFDIMGHMMAK